MSDYNLTADGYGMTSALNARTAADAIRQRKFDLVLLDINLPDGNGFELCKKFKAYHIYRLIHDTLHYSPKQCNRNRK